MDNQHALRIGNDSIAPSYVNTLLYKNFIVKYSPTGNVLWYNYSDGVDFTDLSVNSTQGVYFTGSIGVFGDLHSQNLPQCGFANNSNSGYTDFVIGGYTSAGDITWANNITGTYREVAGCFDRTSCDEIAFSYLKYSGGNDTVIVKRMSPSGNCSMPIVSASFTSSLSLLTATFTNTSLGATSYLWDFGDNTTSTQTNPVHTYSTPGYYSVTLTAYGSNCSDRICKTLNLCFIPAQPNSISGPTTVCAGSTNTYTISAVTGASSYSWVLPGGWTGTSTGTNISAMAGPNGGVITVYAVNICGTSPAQTLNVSVNNVGATITPTSALCNGSCDGTATSSPTGTGPFTFLWSPGNQTTQNINALCAGSYTLQITGAGGCAGTQTTTVSEPSLITTNTTASLSTVCSGSCTTLGISVNGGTSPYTYLWQPGNFTTSSPNVCPGSTATFTCTVADLNSCTSIDSITISVNSLPTVNMNAQSYTACINSNSDTLTGTPTGGVFSGQGVTGNNFDPSAAGQGTWTITYTFTDNNGCSNSAMQSINVGLCTGIQNSVSQNGIVIYPNPFNEKINIILDESNSADLTILNLLGETISRSHLQNGINEIDTHSLPNGIYITQIKSAERVFAQKLVKQN
jgi:PKD repeat protein